MTFDEENPAGEFEEQIGEQYIPLFLITSNNEIRPYTIDNPPSPTNGDQAFYIHLDDEIRQQIKQEATSTDTSEIE